MPFKLKEILKLTPELESWLKEHKDRHPADIAEALEELNAIDMARVFIPLDGETAALVLRNLKTKSVNSLLDALGPERIAAILDEMSLDDAADFLGEVSENVKDELLDLMEADEAEDLKELSPILRTPPAAL